MFKTKIPSIENEEAVIEWFLKNDNKIKDPLFDSPSIHENAKKEILSDLRNNTDASALQAFIDKVSNYYTESVLPEIVSKQKNNEKISSQLITTEWILTVKMRILGYFLLKKYGVQPK